MRTDRFQLPSFTRLAISEGLIFTLMMLLCLPSAVFARPRESAPAREPGFRAVIAPLAGQIEVNTTGDGDNLNPSTGCDTDAGTPGDQCSLRAAIQRANALAGDDEIRFNIPTTQPNCDPSVGQCTINLTQALPDLSTNIRIQSPAPGLLTVRRSTGGDYRIFRVTFANEVTLSGLRIVNGKPAGISSGGGLANASTARVNIVDCIFTDNFGGAIAGSGGAISNDGIGTC